MAAAEGAELAVPALAETEGAAQAEKEAAAVVVMEAEMVVLMAAQVGLAPALAERPGAVAELAQGRGLSAPEMSRSVQQAVCRSSGQH